METRVTDRSIAINRAMMLAWLKNNRGKIHYVVELFNLHSQSSSDGPWWSTERVSFLTVVMLVIHTVIQLTEACRYPRRDSVFTLGHNVIVVILHVTFKVITAKKERK